MAWSTPVARGSAVETASDNAISVNPSANLVVGRMVVCAVAIKNIATADGASNTVTSVQDTQSHVWTKVEERTETEAGAGNDGSTIAVFYTVVTTQIGTGDSVTANLSGNIGDKIITLTEVQFDSTNAIPRVHQVGLGPNAISAAVSSLPSQSYYLFGAAAAEGSDNAKTPDADYTERFDTRSQNAASAITIHVQDRIATLTSDTCTSTLWTNTQPYALLVAFFEGMLEAVPAGAIAVTGQTPTLVKTALMVAGAIALSGQYVDVAFAGPDAGVITVAGAAPTVSVGAGSGNTTIAPPAGSLAFTGQQETLAFVLPTPAGAVTISGLPLDLRHTIPIAAGAVVLSGQTPIPVHVVPQAVGAIALTGLAPTVTNTAGQVNIPQAAGSVTLTGLTPTVARGYDVPAGALTLTGLALSTAHVLPQLLGSVTLSGLTPTLVKTTAIPSGGVTLAGLAPIVKRTLEIPAGSVAFTGTTTALLFTIPIPVGSIALTGQLPSVSSINGVLFPVGVLTLTGTTSTLTHVLPVSAGSLAVNGVAPSLVNLRTIAVPSGSLALTGAAGTLANNRTIAVPVGTVTISGTECVLLSVLPVPAGSIALSGLAPIPSMVRFPDDMVDTSTGYLLAVRWADYVRLVRMAIYDDPERTTEYD